MGECPPGMPFTNFVVNLCVSTMAHRDVGDKQWCATFTVGSFEGGEICLHEAGLVFDSRPGDLIIFQSQRETHFNLHMKGVRCSLVLHSDRMGEKWADGYNRWNYYVH